MANVTPAQRFTFLLQNSCWVGAGCGHFPTLAGAFEFGAQLRFEKPKPATKSYFLMSFLESWKKGKRGEIGMHYENGFLRLGAEADQLEWCIAHNFGITEVAKGRVSSDGLKAIFDSTSIGNASTVTATRREMTITVDANDKPVKLRDVFFMATKDVSEVTEHLVVEYVPEPWDF